MYSVDANESKIRFFKSRGDYDVLILLAYLRPIHQPPPRPQGAFFITTPCSISTLAELDLLEKAIAINAVCHRLKHKGHTRGGLQTAVEIALGSFNCQSMSSEMLIFSTMAQGFESPAAS